MEVLVLNNNTWNSLTVFRNRIIGIIQHYQESFDCVQMNE